MAGLCPGKSQFSKRAKDLHPAVFRRLVARRARQYDPDRDIPLTGSERDRRKNERLILEKVSETADFLPASYLTLGADRANAVCRIVVPSARGRAFGTGFLIAPGVIMTNHHVLGSAAEAAEATAEFGFEEGRTPVIVAIRPRALFVTDTALDFTIVAVEGQGAASLRPIKLLRSPTLITRGEPANIIQHPNARRKEIAVRNNPVMRVLDDVLRYQTDTEPGSSGSPVFNDQWELVALHHAGVANSDGTATNEGIRISAIVDFLEREFRRNESAGPREAIRGLMDSIEDSSPLVGFFDMHGLRETSREIQVDDFQGTPEFADVGVWNIEHFNNGVSADRVSDVADVVARLSLDVLGLTEVQSGALQQLTDELAARGSRHAFVLRDTRGSQDIAVLYDTDTTEVTRRPDIGQRNRSLLSRQTSAGKTAFPRWPLFAECKVDGVKFMLLVVHLKAFGDAQSRERRALAAQCLAEIIEDIRANEALPCVLGGDFNNRIDDDVLDALTSSPDMVVMTADDATDGAISYVGTSHRSLIDHIMVSSDVQLGSIDGDDTAIVRLDRSVADFADRVSDHVPLVFRMVLRDEPLDVDPAADEDEGPATIAIPTDAVGVSIDFV